MDFDRGAIMEEIAGFGDETGVGVGSSSASGAAAAEMVMNFEPCASGECLPSFVITMDSEQSLPSASDAGTSTAAGVVHEGASCLLGWADDCAEHRLFVVEEGASSTEPPWRFGNRLYCVGDTHALAALNDMRV